MMIAIPNLLDAAALARVRAIIDPADWIDGNATSGPQSALAKRNEQLPEDGDAARQAGAIVLDALGRSPLFFAAALPLKVFPPLFNRYGPGQTFGTHVDNAIRIQRGSDFRIRSDLSVTLFLEDPVAYDGGELVVEDRFGAQQVKLAAGDAVVYPSSSLHHVTPVTRGMRVASFFWLQSMVRDDGARSILFDLDQNVQRLSAQLGGADKRSILFDLDQNVQRLSAQLGGADRSVIELTGVYHNLLRRWADA